MIELIQMLTMPKPFPHLLVLGVVLFLSAIPSCAGEVHIPTSEVVRIAQIIARAEGYNIENTKIYYFDIGSKEDESPLVKGYVTIGFYINGNIRSTISISKSTGQAVDMNSCEIFDYPQLKQFQVQVSRLSNSREKTPNQIADDAGSENMSDPFDFEITAKVA
jgi:hypothetical protein